jgi:hypothetical protein
MTTTTTEAITDDGSSFLPSSLYNIQYPNCQRGMFSLREPFKDMSTAVIPTRDLTPATVQPTYLNDDQGYYLFIFFYLNHSFIF